MSYITFGLVIFWSIFLATPREGVIVALILFAVCVFKMLRMEIKTN